MLQHTATPRAKKPQEKPIGFRHVDRKLPLIRDACERKIVVAAVYVKRVIVSSKTVIKHSKTVIKHSNSVIFHSKRVIFDSKTVRLLIAKH